LLRAWEQKRKLSTSPSNNLPPHESSSDEDDDASEHPPPAVAPPPPPLQQAAEALPDGGGIPGQAVAHADDASFNNASDAVADEDMMAPPNVKLLPRRLLFHHLPSNKLRKQFLMGERLLHMLMMPPSNSLMAMPQMWRPIQRHWQEEMVPCPIKSQFILFNFLGCLISLMMTPTSYSLNMSQQNLTR
jgi:hypothetical protein